jgi:hypothetical protein
VAKINGTTIIRMPIPEKKINSAKEKLYVSTYEESE